MTLSINCKEVGNPLCNHTIYGETEDEIMKNVKEHAIKEHDYTEESWNAEMAENIENFKSAIRDSYGKNV